MVALYVNWWCEPDGPPRHARRIRTGREPAARSARHSSRTKDSSRTFGGRNGCWSDPPPAAVPLVKRERSSYVARRLVLA